MRAWFALGIVLVLCLSTAPLAAQQPAPPASEQPTPSAQPAPYPYPYPYPPQPYPPYPYAYGYPPPAQPAAQEPPRELPYHEGEPSPRGYRYVERTRSGMLIAGSLVLGIPYVLGLYAAAAANFENGSGWLAVPAVGPFLMIAARDDRCDERDNSAGDAFECIGEVWLATILVLDGLAQTAGATLLIFGVSSTKKVWVRQDVAVTITPTRLGSGYGLGVVGSF